MTRRESLLADGLLILVTVIWGTSFPLTKQVLAQVPNFSYTTIRYGIAFIALAIFAGPNLWRLGRKGWRDAGLLGGLLLLGFMIQTAGLRLTSSTHSAFITSLSVPLVPFASIALTRKQPPLGAWIGCLLAFAGCAFLTLQSGFRLMPGDAISLGCAFVWAFLIVLIGEIMPRYQAMAMTAAMAAVCVLGAGAMALVIREAPPPLAAMPWPQILWLGLALGGFSMWAQNTAQQHTPAYHAAIIFSLEPIWASLFAHQWAGEPLGPRIWISAAIILAGIAISELWPEVLPSPA